MSQAKPDALLAGATGRTGEALLNALLASGRYGRVHQLTNREQVSSHRGLEYWQLPEPLSAETLQHANAPAVRDVYIMSFADRLHSQRDKAVHTVPAELAEALAAAAAKAGAERLFIVCPLTATEQMSSFQHFYAGAETTLNLARLPYRRVAILLPTEAATAPPAQGFWPKLRHAYLSQFRLMLPQSTAPFTPGRFCEAVLRVAEQGGSGMQVYGATALHALLKTK